MDATAPKDSSVLMPRTACGISSSAESRRINIAAPPWPSSNENQWRSYCHLLRKTSCNDCQPLTKYCAILIHIIPIRHRPSYFHRISILMISHPLLCLSISSATAACAKACCGRDAHGAALLLARTRTWGRWRCAYQTRSV